MFRVENADSLDYQALGFERKRYTKTFEMAIITLGKIRGVKYRKLYHHMGRTVCIWNSERKNG